MVEVSTGPSLNCEFIFSLLPKNLRIMEWATLLSLDATQAKSVMLATLWMTNWINLRPQF
jgi:hypothetical protein